MTRDPTRAGVGAGHDVASPGPHKGPREGSHKVSHLDRNAGQRRDARDAQPDVRLDILRRGLGVLGLRDAPIPQLIAFADLFAKWNRLYNLTSVRDPLRAVHLHLLDCLAAIPPLDRRLAAAVGPRVLDVGSGGGLPGAVWAIVRPGWSVCCVDAVAKKASFVRQVASELGLKNLEVEHARVESLQQPACDVVASRAFGSLSDFASLTRRQVATGGCWMAMKGRRPEEELAALPREVEVFHVEQLVVPGLDVQRCLVWMQPR